MSGGSPGPGYLPVTDRTRDARAWQARAACRDHPAPERWHSPRVGDTAEALSVCGTCPVSLECLEYAVATPERFGVWGGLTAPERGWDASDGKPLPSSRSRRAQAEQFGHLPRGSTTLSSPVTTGPSSGAL